MLKNLLFRNFLAQKSIFSFSLLFTIQSTLWYIDLCLCFGVTRVQRSIHVFQKKRAKILSKRLSIENIWIANIVFRKMCSNRNMMRGSISCTLNLQFCIKFTHKTGKCFKYYLAFQDRNVISIFDFFEITWSKV